MSRFFTLLLCIFITNLTFGQNAQLYGSISDGGLNEPLPFATIAIEELHMGTTSELDGNYRLTNIPEGTYEVAFSYLGYETQTMTLTFSSGDELEQNITLTEGGVMMNEVVVKGQATGQRAAINQQINSSNIVNVISQEKLQELPDQNAAEAVGRLAGVSVYRDAGEGQRVSVRGISPRFNSITINGERLPSTEESDRSVDLSMISPDMLAGIELFKSITPDMDGDAIGGSINFTVAKAEEGLRVQGRLLPGYNQLRDDFGQFRGSVSVSNRFFDNKLGIIATANYQRANRSNESRVTDYLFEGFDQEDDPVLSVSNHILSDKRETRSRYGGSLTMDYAFNKKHSLLLNSSVGITNRDELRYQRRYRIADNYQDFDLQGRERKISLFTNSLSGSHVLGPIELEWRSSYASSLQDTPEEVRARFRELAAIKSSIADAQDFNGIQAAYGHNLENTILYNTRYNFTRVDESRATSQIDLKYPFKWGKNLGGFLKTGVKYLRTDRERDREGVEINPYLAGGSPASTEPGTFIGMGSQILLANFMGPYENEGFYDGLYDILPGTEGLRESFYTSLEGVDLAAHNALFGTNYQQGDLISYQGHIDFDKVLRFRDAYISNFQEDLFINAGDYKGSESVSAAYLMTELNIGKRLDVRGGVRYEETDQEYTSFIIEGSRLIDGDDDTGISIRSKTAGRTYGELLPMANLKFRASEWMDLRLAVTKTLARPNFFNIVPWEYINPTGRELQYGRPQLLHTTAWNYDAFISFYNKFGLFTIGGFYKELKNIDFLATYVETDDSEGYKGWTITEPRNIEGISTVRGIELDFQSNLSSLDNFLKGVVFGANLTLSSSKTFYPLFTVTTEYVGPPTFFETTVLDTVRQGNIVGQANVLANINLGYERGGFSGRISMIHQSDALSPGSPGIGSATSGVGTIEEQDFYDQATYRFDIAIKQKIDKKGKWTVLLNLNNLTNTPERSFLGVVDRLRDEEFYGMTADLGLVFKFR